jgi:hypothetical protein
MGVEKRTQMRVLRIFARMIEEIPVRWRKLYDDELYDLYFPLLLWIQPRIIGWAGNVA